MNHRSSSKYGVDGPLNAGEYVSKYSTNGYANSTYFDDDQVIQWIDEEDD